MSGRRAYVDRQARVREQQRYSETGRLMSVLPTQRLVWNQRNADDVHRGAIDVDKIRVLVIEYLPVGIGFPTMRFVHTVVWKSHNMSQKDVEMSMLKLSTALPGLRCLQMMGATDAEIPIRVQLPNGEESDVLFPQVVDLVIGNLYQKKLPCSALLVHVNGVPQIKHECALPNLLRLAILGEYEWALHPQFAPKLQYLYMTVFYQKRISPSFAPQLKCFQLEQFEDDQITYHVSIPARIENLQGESWIESLFIDVHDSEDGMDPTVPANPLLDEDPIKRALALTAVTNEMLNRVPVTTDSEAMRTLQALLPAIKESSALQWAILARVAQVPAKYAELPPREASTELQIANAGLRYSDVFDN